MKNMAALLICLPLLGCNGFQSVPPPPETKNLDESQKNPDPGINSAIIQFIKKNATDYVGEGTIPDTGQKKFPSLVLAVITPEGKTILGLGMTAKKVPPTGKDIYPVSSISKMITGLIMARGVSENAFVVSTKLNELLPPDIAPLVGNRTLGQAVSHYASFRQLPTNLDFANKNAPAATYSKEKLINCLNDQNTDNHCALTKQPLGTDYLYSNIGIGLLGLALMNHYKANSFEDLLTRQLTADLGMSSTSAVVSKYTSLDNIIEGYTQTNEAVTPATMGVLASAGAVLSNGEDMLKLLNEILNPSGEWKKTMEIATTPIQPGIAFAIDIDSFDSLRLFSKSGEQAGYSSLIMWNPKNKSGVVALANRGLASKSLAKFLIKIHKQLNEAP